MHFNIYASLLPLILFSFSACSSPKPPSESLATAKFVVQRAEQTRAAQYSAQELNLAQEKLQLAQKAMGQRKYLDARRLSEQATVDATYAMSKSEADQFIYNAAHSAATSRIIQSTTP